jgi:hypothetical protein
VTTESVRDIAVPRNVTFPVIVDYGICPSALFLTVKERRVFSNSKCRPEFIFKHIVHPEISDIKVNEIDFR